MGSEDRVVACSKCGEWSKIQLWNNVSLAECVTREMRREYMDIRDAMAYKGSDYYYMCPVCRQWCEGGSLKVKMMGD